MKQLGWRCALAGLMMLVAFESAAQSAPNVQAVRVVNRGPGPLDEASVLSFVGIQADQLYNPNQVNRDVRALRETGRFADVKAGVEMMPDGGSVDVIYEIWNKPRIRSLLVVGARHVSNRRVRDWLELSVGDRVDDVTMSVQALNVYENYRKRYFHDPKLTWSIDVNQETGMADVRVTVEEGERVRVRKVVFEGNDSVPSSRLRRTMEQKGTGLFSFITKRNRFDPRQIEMDREALRYLYMDRGFLDVRIGEPIIEEASSSRIRVRIPIEEGPVYRIGDVTVEGVTLFSLDNILPLLSATPGAVASVGLIERNRMILRDYYGARGYIRTRVQDQLEPLEGIAVVDLAFTVTEGELAYIRDIEIRGNTRTKDKVIRRELAVLPGDIFDEVRVRRSEARLMNMGYFNHVRASDRATGEPHVYDLIVDVEEGRTGELMAGAGFSSIDRVLGFASIAQNNFDLFGWPHFSGGGQRVQLYGQFGSRRNDVNFSFVEPWFLDRQLEFDVNLFRRDSRFYEDDYEERSLGGEMGLAWPVGRFSRLRVSYGLQEYDIRNVRETAPQVLKDEEGSRTKSAVSLTYRRDTRDRPLVPQRGNLSILGAQLAGGALMGETDLYKLEARTSHYVPLWLGHVFSLRGAVEVVEEYGDSDRVPIFDRLFLGGMRDVRGFRYRDVGPKDETGSTPLGGRTSAFLSAEYTVPVFPAVRVATFYDIGMVWDEAYEMNTEDLNSAVGIGIRFDIQGFPLRFDYAWPQMTDDFNDRKSGRFNFMIGHVY
jgi:outer membrane protein insertion porin family